MAINLPNFQRRIAFGNVMTCPFKKTEMSDEEIGFEVLRCASDGLRFKLETAGPNYQEEIKKRADFYSKLAFDNDAKGTNIRKVLGRQIRTYA